MESPNLALLPGHEHLVKDTWETELYYPDHKQRTESSLYRHNHHHLIVVEKRGCYVCHRRQHLETHHFHCEWAFANAVDWDRMKAIHPGFAWDTFHAASDFIDSVYNLLVLCAEHHRHKDRGIHCMPFPLWQAQRFVRDDFVLFPEQA